MMYFVARITPDSEPDPLAIVEAESADEALEQATKRLTVASIRRGVVLGVWTLGNFPEQYRVQYDGDSMDRRTKTKTRKIGRPPVKVRT